MPLESELPDHLSALAKRNAISLNDESWSADVTRLAANLTMDVSGSVAENKLAWVQRLILFLLAAPLVFGLVWLGYDLKCSLNDTPYIMGSAMIPLILAGFVLFYTLRWFHPSRQWCVWAALSVAVLGGISTFLLYKRIPGESINANYVLTNACITLTVMLVFVGLSGFKPNQRTD